MGAFLLKSKKRLNVPSGITSFDLRAPILPLEGAGGVSFQNTLQDFEYLLTEKFFDPTFEEGVSIDIDEKYYLLTIKLNSAALQIQFDMFSGKINYISCGEGYEGSLTNTLHVGSRAQRNLFVENGLSFDLDLYWFSRYPFDGLIVYPPPELREECWDAAASGKRYPEFNIEEITLLDDQYAVKQFGSELQLR